MKLKIKQKQVVQIDASLNEFWKNSETDLFTTVLHHEETTGPQDMKFLISVLKTFLDENNL